MLDLIKKGVPPYKVEQLKIFFRFLKEYKCYNIFIRKFYNIIDKKKYDGYIFDYFEKRYVKITSKYLIVKNYLYVIPPINFPNCIGDEYLKDLWCYQIIDHYVKNNGNSPFDSVDVKCCCLKLNVNFKKYCKEYYKNG